MNKENKKLNAPESTLESAPKSALESTLESALESATKSTQESTPKSAPKPTPISKKILNTIGRTNARFGLIKEGDRVLVGLSGGKDSILLSLALAHMKAHAPFKFDFKAVSIAYGVGEDFSFLTEILAQNAVPHEVYKTTIMDTITQKRRAGSSYCSFCSRLRRGHLYTYALENGFNKLALAHHLDDAVESFFMNLSHNGALRSMPPIYRAENGLFVIRPLIFLRERQIIDFVRANNIAVAPDCNCPAKQPTSERPPIARAATKDFLRELENANPHFFRSLKNAFSNIHTNSFCDARFMDEH